MEVIKDFKITQIPLWTIAIVTTSEPDYEMDRTMLVEDYPEYGDYVIVSGEHCSCYEFSGTEWDAIQYTRDEVIKLAEGWQSNGYGSERIIAPLILSYLRSRE